MKIENRLITKRERFFMYTLFSFLFILTVYWLHSINYFLDSYAFHLGTVFGYDFNKTYKMFLENGLLGIISKEFILSLWLFSGSVSIFYSSQKKTLFGFVFSSSVFFSICSIMIFLLKLYMVV
ncbi:hypothetical protein GOR35_004362 [Salmonella enterica]|nr:hypothetical protein [Salmonella enterica]